jgi:hypothetical protein
MSPRKAGTEGKRDVQLNFRVVAKERLLSSAPQKRPAWTCRPGFAWSHERRPA